jgi:CheY-like chemotaxis protein
MALRHVENDADDTPFFPHGARARCRGSDKRNRMMRRLQGLRVLIVEDEFLLAMDIENALREEGAEVVGPAVTVKDAIATAETADLNAAVLDLNVRGEMSYPVASVLDSRGIPFLFATGYAASRIPDMFQYRPCLRKPFTWQALISALEQLVAEPSRSDFSRPRSDDC